jgi:hypothetical protein
MGTITGSATMITRRLVIFTGCCLQMNSSGCSAISRRAMQGVPPFIIEREREHFTKADPVYGEGVAKVFGLPINTPKAVA